MSLLSVVDQCLNSEPGGSAFAVVDGAAFPNILAILSELNCPHLCIHRGELIFEEALTAAYLIPVEPDSAVLTWFLKTWGQHCGFLMTADCNLSTLRNHFRQFLVVYDERGQPMKFRFYDPRVIRAFFNICSQQQYQLLFGPVDQFLVESVSGKQLVRFFSQLDGRQNETLTLEN